MDQEPTTGSTNSSNKAIKTVIVVAIIGLLAGGAVYLTQQNEPQPQNNTTTQQNGPANQESVQSSESSNESAASTYKDGTYNASGSYKSPGGTERVDVQLTLAGDSISEITVTPQAATPTSKQFQGEFVNNYKSMVVGKNIDEVELSKVAGSSLTSGGFNEALTQIKDQAKS